MLRTHTCGDLTKKETNKTVTLAGWMHAKRLHGGIIFIDVRDRYGLTQIVADTTHNHEAYQVAEKLGKEDVIQIKGIVRNRREGFTNPKLKTGEIEVLADQVTLLTAAEPLPIDVEGEVINASEDTRLKYRYIDLRRDVMKNNIMTRHKIAKKVRDYFDKLGFLDIETPMLTRSTPEGARDYLVPSRVQQGQFYALPQSPQIFKQLLMVSGFDRYMQITRCFRDEDLRADRQPEFTQIDVEMSFIEESDIMHVVEGLLCELWKEVLHVELKPPFPKMTYKEAMEKYGSDKPDVRFGLELHDVSTIVKDSQFQVFTSVITAGGKVKCICAPGCAAYSRKDTDELTEVVKVYDAKGLGTLKVANGKLDGAIAKFFSDAIQHEIIKAAHAKEGDLLLFVADHKHHIVDTALGNLRLHLAKKLNLIKPNTYSFLWVVDFPLVEFDENEQRHVAVHHPFTAPKKEDLAFLETEPSKVRARAYDITLNGVEIGGGSIRINEPKLQQRMFSVLGINPTEAQRRFGFLLEAFKYGAPPHGGIAFGLDRICAIMTGNESIREVIAFPKNKAAVNPLDNSPSAVDTKQLDELHIAIKK